MSDRSLSPLRVWLLAARPATLPAAVAPVVVGTAAGAVEAGALTWLPALAALACAVLLQIGTNLANDVADFERGADTTERLGPVRVTQSGLATPATVRRATAIVFALAVLVGAYLVWVGGWPILAIGVAGIAAGLAYTGGRFPLAYHGLGEPFVFLFFGLAAVAGSAYLQSGIWTLEALLVSLPVGLLATNILVVNNLRDIPTDAAAGKRTLAVRLGEVWTRRLYATLVLAAFACIPLFWRFEVAGPWVWLAWLALPLALVLNLRLARGAAGCELNPVLKRTAQLHVLYGLLLAAGIVL